MSDSRPSQHADTYALGPLVGAASKTSLSINSNSLASHSAIPKKVALGLLVTLVLSVFQIYAVPMAGVYLSLYFLSAYTLIGAVLLRRIRPDAVVQLSLMLLGIKVLSLAWSPDRFLGIREIAFMVPFLIIYVAVRQVAVKSERLLTVILKTYVFAALANSILVIIFRLSPDWEFEFLFSGIAKIFINPNSLSSFAALLDNNVSDPMKSGGLFLNANVGAVASEIAAYLSIAVSGNGRRWLWRLIAAVHFSAVIASGSKSALALLVLAPYAAWFLMQANVRTSAARRVVKIGLFFGGIAAAVLIFFTLPESDIGMDAVLNASRRAAIWQYAAQAFFESPILGQGFGGWALGFANYAPRLQYLGLNAHMPPHNGFIILWSESGIIAPILAATIIGSQVKSIWITRRLADGRLVSGAALAALGCIVTHAMGDNFSIFGEPHIQAGVAALCGWISARRTKMQQLA